LLEKGRQHRKQAQNPSPKFVKGKVRAREDIDDDILKNLLFQGNSYGWRGKGRYCLTRLALSVCGMMQYA
jgi:hypothetical protein